MSELFNEIDLIALLERIDEELRHCRVFVSTKERIHPAGLGFYDDVSEQVKEAIQSYQKGMWRILDDEQ